MGMRINVGVFLLTLLGCTSVACVGPPKGSFSDEMDMGGVEDMTPDLATPEDLGEDLGERDMPAVMVCSPSEVRCTEDGDREQCAVDGEQFEPAPCENGELCEGDGMCVKCSDDPDRICELTRFDAASNNAEGCLGQSILASGDLVIIGNPCLVQGTGAVQAASVSGGNLQAEFALGTGESLGVRFGESLAVLGESLFVGEPGDGGGSIRFIPRFDGGMEANHCQLRPEEMGGHVAWGSNIKVLPEKRLLLVSDPEFAGSSNGRIFLYDISETPDCSSPGDILSLRAVIAPDANAGDARDFGAVFDARLVNNTLEVVIGAPTGEGDLYFATFSLVLAMPADGAEQTALLIASGDTEGVLGLGNTVLIDNANNRAFVTARDPNGNPPLFVLTLPDGTAEPTLDPVEVEGMGFDTSYELGRSLLSASGDGLWTTASSEGEDFWLYIALVEPVLGGSPPSGVIERKLMLPREGAAEETPTGLGAAMVMSPEGDYLITSAPEWKPVDSSKRKGAVFVLGIRED